MSHASEVETEAMLRELGAMAKRRREEIGINRPELAKEAGIESEDPIRAFEYGKGLPPEVTQRKLENALGWKLGVIAEVMRMPDRSPRTLTMEELDAEDSLFLAGQGGVPSLASASDGELLAEVARRGL